VTESLGGGRDTHSAQTKHQWPYSSNLQPSKSGEFILKPYPSI